MRGQSTGPVRRPAALSSEPSARLAVSVHGEHGVVDLVVPGGAAAADLAREYAARAGLTSVPLLHHVLGGSGGGGREVIGPAELLADAGVRSGDVLVAAAGAPAAATARGPWSAYDGDRRERSAGAGAVVAAVLGGAAVLAGWSAGVAGGGTATATASVLAGALALALLPVRRGALERALVSPAFALGAALALAWAPGPERLPMVLGVAAMAAAVVAAAVRTAGVDPAADQGLVGWMVAGVLVFVVAGACALAGAPPAVPWAVLLLLAVLAARIVPGLAVDAPDQVLLDLERLAVTSWSARDPAVGRRRTVVRPEMVEDAAARAARTVTAAAAAVVAVVATTAPLLLASADADLDRIGARVMVGAAAGALLLAARSHRHAAARALLGAAGLVCGVTVVASVLSAASSGLSSDPSSDQVIAVALVAAGLGTLCVVAGVATGRGWRSVWWSRRAELAEGLCGAAAVAALMVASGAFRALWQLTG